MWVDPFKIGQLAMMHKVASSFNKAVGGGKEGRGSKVDKDRDNAVSDILSEDGKGADEDKRRKWIEHMTLAPDGFILFFFLSFLFHHKKMKFNNLFLGLVILLESK